MGPSPGAAHHGRGGWRQPGLGVRQLHGGRSCRSRMDGVLLLADYEHDSQHSEGDSRTQRDDRVEGGVRQGSKIA